MPNYSYNKAEKIKNTLKLKNIEIRELKRGEKSNTYQCIGACIFDKHGNLIDSPYTSVSQLVTPEHFLYFFKKKDIEQGYYENLCNILNNKIKYKIQSLDYTNNIIKFINIGLSSVDTAITENIKRDKIIFREYYGLLEYKYTKNRQALCQKYKNKDDKPLKPQSITNVIKTMFDIFYLDFLTNFESTANQITQILQRKDAIKLKKPELLQQYKVLLEEIIESLDKNICFYIDFERGLIVKKGIDRDALQINNNLTVEDVEEDFKNIEATEKETIVKSRIGQDKLREKLLENKCCCELCDLKLPEVLVASHIKSWAESDDEEKLDLENVLLLCAIHDKLFDKGLISFKDNGDIIISQDLDEKTRALLNIHDESRIENISETKAKFLEYHRTKYKDKLN